MTKLIQPYSLQAFPTEKILKEFKPSRGFVAKGLLELSPEQEELLRITKRNRKDDELGWQEPAVLPDVRPLFDAIAERMGYDSALLAEGKGETGKPGHDWLTYGDKGGCPLLIRWKTGQGNLLLSIAVTPSYHDTVLVVSALADEAGHETLLQVADVIQSIEASHDQPETIDITVGDTLQKVKIATLHESTGWFVDCPRIVFCLPEDRQLNSIRRRELERLAFSLPLIIGTAEEIRQRNSYRSDYLPLAPNVLRIERIFGTTLDFKADEPLSESIIKEIYRESCDLAGSAFSFAMDEALGAKNCGEVRESRQLIWKEKLDAVATERRMKLNMEANGVEKIGQRGEIRRISLGADVRVTPSDILRDTRPVAKMSGGDLGLSVDLLENLFSEIHRLSDERGIIQHQRMKPKLPIKGEAILPPLTKQYEDTVVEYRRVEDLKSPYTSAHRGLPVRVDKRLIVWRDGDTQALAADFFHLPATKDTHVTNLQRVPIPKT
jgi:hypothetical protein